tara:strand:+ start:237 stop:338 length:102 start_codon:yes stop_codon:yes gene_type:complete
MVTHLSETAEDVSEEMDGTFGTALWFLSYVLVS